MDDIGVGKTERTGHASRTATSRVRASSSSQLQEEPVRGITSLSDVGAGHRVEKGRSPMPFGLWRNAGRAATDG